MRMSVDFIETDRLGAADRGLMYGDGLFETLRVVDRAVPLWPRHVERLRASATRLGLPAPDTDAMLAGVQHLAHGLEDAVARITFTAGVGERGYARPRQAKPTIVISVGPLSLATDVYRDGIALRQCDTRLGDQPLLAGMKHLNRLEQVLARSEWENTCWQEGLMADQEGRVVCATAANLFAVIGGRLVTPPVDRCGVAGVARAEVLASGDVDIGHVSPQQVVEADEVFLTSAVRGILPVRAFAGRTWQPGPVTRHWQAHWRAIGLPLPNRSKDSD
ncbi:aminodeoxychorismate lyase [Luteibacter sp. dw_328]|uniref:aminodeoxychorismate lyase n=1 Tax=Luteibacter sp. dw_328 TaxID=2719796 RepID=UPI0031F30FAF